MSDARNAVKTRPHTSAGMHKLPDGSWISHLVSLQATSDQIALVEACKEAGERAAKMTPNDRLDEAVRVYEKKMADLGLNDLGLK